MKYMGSKARHANAILPILFETARPDAAYVEPFVGGANVIDKVRGRRRIARDIHPDLVILLKAMSDFDYWIPPHQVSEQDYAAARRMGPCVLKSYIGFALSYGGKWFGGYRRDSAGKRNYSFEAYKNYMKQAPNLCGVEFSCGSYHDVETPSGSIIYCDPPYRGTTNYSGPKFDSDMFWGWCAMKISEGHQVFVSEYSAPEEWECIWEKEVPNTLAKNTGEKRGVERLYRWRS